jgi:hypothetical protein
MIEGFRCECCQHYFACELPKITHDKKKVCVDCSINFFGKCEFCTRLFPADQIFNAISPKYQLLCEECGAKLGFKCDGCNKFYTDLRKKHKFNENNYCLNCCRTYGIFDQIGDFIQWIQDFNLQTNIEYFGFECQEYNALTLLFNKLENEVSSSVFRDFGFRLTPKIKLILRSPQEIHIIGKIFGMSEDIKKEIETFWNNWHSIPLGFMQILL